MKYLLIGVLLTSLNGASYSHEQDVDRSSVNVIDLERECRLVAKIDVNRMIQRDYSVYKCTVDGKECLLTYGERRFSMTCDWRLK